MAGVTGQTANRRPRVAIVGAGASGMSAAWLLAEDADVVVFEKHARLGGHAHSVQIGRARAPLSVDLGAQFFHPATYPTFFRLLDALGVATRASRQTFTVLEDEGRTFFSAGASLRNLVGPGSTQRRQWLGELLQLNANAWRTLGVLPWSHTLAEVVPSLGLSADFVERVLYPVVGASFGTCREQSATLSAKSALHYLTSGLRPVAVSAQSYREIVGGCERWIAAAQRQLGATELRTGTGVTRLERAGSGWRVRCEGREPELFDHVVLALQPNVTAELLSELPGAGALAERLRAVRYVRADLLIHGDPSVMPPDRRAWSGFVVHDARWAPGASVWLGRGMPRRMLFKSWASNVPVRGPIHAAETFWHPVMDREYYAAQDQVQARRTADGLWFAGSYAAQVDNHESAVVAALHAAARIAPQSARVLALSDTALRLPRLLPERARRAELALP